MPLEYCHSCKLADCDVAALIARGFVEADAAVIVLAPSVTTAFVIPYPEIVVGVDDILDHANPVIQDGFE